MDSEMKKFQDDLLESVKQMRQGKTARITQVELSAAAEVRQKPCSKLRLVIRKCCEKSALNKLMSFRIAS